MDFEKKAIEIAYGFWCGNCEGPSARPCKKHEGCYGLILETKQALIRAHRQGQEEMRERAAATCIELQAGFLSNGYSLGQPMASIGERVACRSCSDKIEALPLTPIKEEKSTPEFLPKASTKEVGIK